jgi:hypothetical protein
MTRPGVGELIARSFALYMSQWRRVLALTMPIVIVVTGVTALGLGELGASYRASESARDAYIDFAASGLVAVPLINSILARLVERTAAGGSVSSSELLAQAFEVFPNVLLVIVVWVGAVLAGALLIVPAFYFLVSWYFVVQAVVIDGDRGLAPITRSAALVRGNWWRSAGIGLCFQLIAAVPHEAIVTVFDSVAKSTNSYAVVVAGEVVSNALTLPFLAIGATIYYLHLRAAARV